MSTIPDTYATAPTVHHLKVWSEFWPYLESGDKTFEARRDDRAFRVGDTLVLQEWDRHAERHTGNELRRVVSYKLSGPGWGVESGYCILGLAVVRPAADAVPDDLTRCAVCAWPLAELAKDGCVAGNCSQRPFPVRLYSPARYAAEQAAMRSRP